jgi:hypothetical protein
MPVRRILDQKQRIALVVVCVQRGDATGDVEREAPSAKR